MSSVIDDLVVGVLVLGAVAYAAASLGPRGWRARALAMAARLLARTPSILGLRGVASRLSEKAAAKSGGACGGCDTCGSETAKNQPGSVASKEVRIPVSSIGKRG